MLIVVLVSMWRGKIAEDLVNGRYHILPAEENVKVTLPLFSASHSRVRHGANSGKGSANCSWLTLYSAAYGFPVSSNCFNTPRS